MLRTLLPLLLLALALPLQAGQDRKPTPADQAKTVAEAFLKGFQLLNLDDIEKTVEVPWFHDGKTVIYERKELSLDFARLLDRYRGTPKLKFELKKQLAYNVVREEIEPDERKLMDQVLKPEDFVQLVGLINPETGKKEAIVLFIRVKDGVAKVVGLKN